MRKNLSTALTAICIFWLTMCSAQADSSSPTTPATSPAKTSAHPANVPTVIAGFCTGFVVGMPICLVRKFGDETIAGAYGIVGDTKHKWLFVSAEAFWTPFAAVVACLEAPVYSWRDAWMAEEPFSKEQFSLGDLDKKAP
jgi:hypothetical protein